MRLIRVQAEPIDPPPLVAKLQTISRDTGAVVSFLGLCRDEAGTLEALELEHYPGMAEAQIGEVAKRAGERWPLLGLCAVHRFGLVRPGDAIVLVATASKHRAAAFEAAAFIMDYLKTDAPFWKREHRRAAGADPRAPESWVAAKDADDRAVKRWT